MSHQYTFLEKKVRSPKRPCGGFPSSPAPSAHAALFRHPAAGAATLGAALSSLLPAAAVSADAAAAGVVAGGAALPPAFFFALACFCSAAVCCSLLRRSCHTELGRPTRIPVPFEPLLLLLRPCPPGTNLRSMEVVVVVVAGIGAAWVVAASSSAAAIVGGAAAATATAAAAAGTAGAGAEDSPRELLREHGALLTLRGAGAGAGGALVALAAAPALVLELALALGALAFGLLALGLPLLKDDPPPPAAECPAERLLEKGQMLMLMSSALPLTRRSAFLPARSRASPPPPALKMSFHLNVTAGRSGVGAMPDSASGTAAASASATASASGSGSGSAGSGSAAAAAESASAFTTLAESASAFTTSAAAGSGTAAWRVWSGSTTPPEKSSSAVSRAGAGFVPTIQNSNSGDAAGDELPDSPPPYSGGGSASTASAIAGAAAIAAATHRPADSREYVSQWRAVWIWEPRNGGGGGGAQQVTGSGFSRVQQQLAMDIGQYGRQSSASREGWAGPGERERRERERRGQRPDAYLSITSRWRAREWEVRGGVCWCGSRSARLGSARRLRRFPFPVASPVARPQDCICALKSLSGDARSPPPPPNAERCGASVLFR
ncbi:hypothetical protein U9M48_016682 [Paspalum notatum var. saurae]|uniref:Uncharacterized protein n=1 Tax=Paspalum notatum var. saurae TaxID=547442 RepID=A0AAQ3WNE4_PASNO